MARSYVARELVQLGGHPAWRMGFTTDNGNVILDVHGLDDRRSRRARRRRSTAIAGVVTVGLFARRGADVILLGAPNRREDTDPEALNPRAGAHATPGGDPVADGRARIASMTNLAVPGLGTFADVAAYMRRVGEAARAASRISRAPTPTQERGLAATHGRGDPPRRGRAARSQCARTSPRATPPATTPRSSTGSRSTPKTVDGDGARASRRSPRCPIRSARSPISRYRPVRHPGRHDARAARRRRHHLRIAAQRDGRRRGPVPQGRQRDDPARRLGGDAQQPGDRRVRARRPARGRPARDMRCSSSRPPTARRSAI